MRTWIPIATLLLVALPSLLPAAAGASEAAPETAAPMVCTYDVVESIAACAGRDDLGRVCVIVFVGPSTPVNRCVDPNVLVPCLRFALVPLTVCYEVEEDRVCVRGTYDGRPFGRCVVLPATTTEAAAAPDAPYCRIGQDECVGYLFCWYATDTCVNDPCYTTACWRAGPPRIPECVVIVPEGGDMGEKVCHDLDGACKVYYERITFVGTWRVCLVPPGGVDGGSSTAASPPPCMDRYWERDIVVGKIVSRSSCEYEVCTYQDGQCRDLLQ